MSCNCNKKSAIQKYNFTAQALNITPSPLNLGASAGLPTGPAIVDRGNNIGVARTGLYRLTVSDQYLRYRTGCPGLHRKIASGDSGIVQLCSVLLYGKVPRRTGYRCSHKGKTGSTLQHEAAHIAGNIYFWHLLP